MNYKSIEELLDEDRTSEESRLEVDRNRIIDEDSILEKLLFDGKNYYLLRSISRENILSIESGNGIEPKEYEYGSYSLSDVLVHATTNSNNEVKRKFISMTADPNVVLTYDRSSRNKFVLIRLSKEEVLAQNKFFSSGDYLLEKINQKIQNCLKSITDKELKLKIEDIFERIETSKSIEEIKEIINGANSSVSTSLIDTEQQYLNENERLLHAKQIAKCKVLNYHRIMQNVEETVGALGTINGYTGIMRVAYHNSEWLTSEKIDTDKMTYIPKIFLDALALIKQAEFQGKDLEQLRILEQGILKLIIEKTEIRVEGYREEYSKKEQLREELTIDKAFKITRGQISYRDVNMQMVSIRALAEMILNKRKIVELLQDRFPNINVSQLLENTYCVNREMITRHNKIGLQIGKNINFLITDYGYNFDEDILRQIFTKTESLTNEQLSNIILQGIDSKEIQDILIITREKNKRIQQSRKKSNETKYIAEALVEGYNLKKVRGALTLKEKERLIKKITKGINKDELKRLYINLEQIKIDGRNLTKDEVFAIIINLAIIGKLGEKTYTEILHLSQEEQLEYINENIDSLDLTINPITIDLLMKRGKKIEELKDSLLDLGVSEDIIKDKDIRNLYTVKQIVDLYFKKYKKRDGSKISNEEKRCIIEILLSSKKLDKNILANLLEKIQQELCINNIIDVYGFIIKLAIEGNNGIDVYSNFIVGTKSTFDSLHKFIEENKENPQAIKEKYEVTDELIDRALLKRGILPEITQQRIKQFGVSEKILEGKDKRNVYEALKIVEFYFKNYKRRDGSKISGEEKRCIIEVMLNHQIWGKCLFTSLVESLQKVLKNEDIKDIYGFIIKLAIEGNGIGIYSDFAYGMANMKLYKFIKENKDNPQAIKEKCKVTDKTIDTALFRRDILPSTIQQRIKELGIAEEILEGKDKRNVYEALKIVENYFKEYTKTEGREITDEEKRCIIELMLDQKILKTCLLSSLVERLQKKLHTENIKTIYGFIIKLAIEGNGIDTYSNFINGCAFKNLYTFMEKNKEQPNVMQEKCRVTDELIDKALLQREILPTNIKQRIKELGVSEKILEEKDKRNVYEALKIVEFYFKNYTRSDGSKISNEEKRCIVEVLLMNKILRACLLSNLVGNLQEILEKEDIKGIYGFIIKLAIEGNNGIDTYSSFLYGVSFNNLCTFIEKNNNNYEILQEKCEVTNELIDKALLQRGILPAATEQRIKELGVSEKILEEKDKKNIYEAIKIVEDYFQEYTKNDGSKITDEEKRCIIEILLTPQHLKDCLLSTLVRNLQEILGKEDIKEIYGFIIRLAIEGNNGIDAYSHFVGGGTVFKNLYRFIEENKDNPEAIQEKCIVTDETIDEAVIHSGKFPEKTTKRLIDLGVSEDIIQEKDKRNVCIVLKIVDEFFKDYKRKNESEITDEEKRCIIEILLTPQVLKTQLLVRLVKRLPLVLHTNNIKEIYGFIIKLAIEGNKIDTYTHFIYGYNSAFDGLERFIEKNKDNPEAIKEKCEVTEDAIEKAVKKAEKIMKRAMKKLKDNGELSSIESTMQGLIQFEKSEQDLEVVIPESNN